MSPLSRAREALAVASLVFLLLLVVSGWASMAGYVPSEREAFDSVLYLRRHGGALAFARDLHAHAASALVLAGALYLLASFGLGTAPRQPRAWWAALALFLLALFACFTGFLLPMDQNAYWGTIVRLGIVETVPGAGSLLADLLRGGPVINASTLTRFYALHAGVLPALLLPPLAVLGAQAAASLRGDAPRARRQLELALVVIVAAYAFAALVPARLEPRAAPGDTEYVPRPEWYFLWLFQLGKYVESLPWLRSLVLPVLLLGAAVAAPFARATGARARWLVVLAAGLGFLGLTGLSRWDDRGLPAKPSYEQALASRAGFLFKEECEICHGASGKGDGSQARTFGLATPDFTSAKFWSGASEDTMRDAVRNGKGEDMPAFAKKLSAEEIGALLELVRTRFQHSK